VISSEWLSVKLSTPLCHLEQHHVFQIISLHDCTEGLVYTRYVPFIHYRNPRLCRVPEALPSAFYWALGKADFAEYRTRQSAALGKELVYCRTLGTSKHSAKTALPSVKHSANMALGKGPLAAVYN
jgi:hypothetical protein